MKKRTSELCSAILLICLIMGQTGCTFGGTRSVFSPTPVPSMAPIATDEPTGTPTPTVKVTEAPALPATDTPVPTAPVSPTSAPTSVPIKKNTPTPKITGTNTPTPKVTATNIPTPEITGTNTPTPKVTATAIPTSAITGTNTPTPKATDTPTPTKVTEPTGAATPTPTNIPKITQTGTPTPVPTSISTPVPTSISTPVPTSTPSPVPTSTSTPAPKITPTTVPTSTSTPVPTATPAGGQVTPAANVSYKVADGFQKYEYPIFEDQINSADEVFADYLTALQNSQGYSFERFYCMADDNAAISFANKLISYGGIDKITVSKTVQYKNCSQYSISVNSRCSFIYLYAAKSGDRSGLLAEEIATLDKALELVNNAKSKKTAFDKELYFHDWLVLNIAYGNPGVKLGTRNGGGYLNGQTPYEALILGKCVCAGYSSSFELLMNLAGIETVYVMGWAGESHAWNRVKLDGQWYNVDVTWDDPVPDTPGKVIYDYFNVPDSFLLQDHTPSDTSLPAATATTYNYYVMSCTPCATQEEVNAYCIEQKELGKTSITILYTGEGNIDVNSIANAILCGFTYSETKTYAFGKILRINL